MLISILNFMLSLVEHEKKTFITSGSGLDHSECTVTICLLMPNTSKWISNGRYEQTCYSHKITFFIYSHKTMFTKKQTKKTLMHFRGWVMSVTLTVHFITFRRYFRGSRVCDAHLICRSTDISKCFRGSLRLRDNESRL